MPPSVIGNLLAINGPACMTSAPQTEHSFSDGARSHNLSRSARERAGRRAGGRAPFSIMGVHNADAAESSLHTLLAHPTALLSSLISPVNASPRLIKNELAPRLLQGGRLRSRATDRRPFHLAAEASEDLRLYAKNSLHRQINQYTLECRGTIPW